MKTDTITIDPTDLNLDCYVDPDELLVIEQQLDALPPSDGITQLIAYSRARRQAMTGRLYGFTGALKYETECDRIYRNLPEEYRW